MYYGEGILNPFPFHGTQIIYPFLIHGSLPIKKRVEISANCELLYPLMFL